MLVSSETGWMLVCELACNTSFYTLRLTRPAHAGGMDAPVSLRGRCTLQTYVCWVASDPGADTGLCFRSSSRISINKGVHEIRIVDRISKPCRPLSLLLLACRLQCELGLMTVWRRHYTNVQKQKKNKLKVWNAACLKRWRIGQLFSYIFCSKLLPQHPPDVRLYISAWFL